MKFSTINAFSQTSMVKAIAKVYQLSFGGEPWNEGYMCPICSKGFPRTLDKKVCDVCVENSREILLIDYWSMNKIITDFYREMSKPDAKCVVVQNVDLVVGFAWGYRITMNPEIDKHLDAPNVHTRLNHDDYFYLDECALLPSNQAKGIGKLLVSYIFQQQTQKQVVLRTKNNSRMCSIIKQMGGRVIQHISNDRVIMTLQTF